MKEFCTWKNINKRIKMSVKNKNRKSMKKKENKEELNNLSILSSSDYSLTSLFFLSSNSFIISFSVKFFTKGTGIWQMN